jgi:hypothetical protein
MVSLPSHQGTPSSVGWSDKISEIAWLLGEKLSSFTILCRFGCLGLRQLRDFAEGLQRRFGSLAESFGDSTRTVWVT